jgi:hypothetical protein
MMHGYRLRSGIKCTFRRLCSKSDAYRNSIKRGEPFWIRTYSPDESPTDPDELNEILDTVSYTSQVRSVVRNYDVKLYRASTVVLERLLATAIASEDCPSALKIADILVRRFNYSLVIENFLDIEAKRFHFSLCVLALKDSPELAEWADLDSVRIYYMTHSTISSDVLDLIAHSWILDCRIDCCLGLLDMILDKAVYPVPITAEILSSMFRALRSNGQGMKVDRFVTKSFSIILKSSPDSLIFQNLVRLHTCLSSEASNAAHLNRLTEFYWDVIYPTRKKDVVTDLITLADSFRPLHGQVSPCLHIVMAAFDRAVQTLGIRDATLTRAMAELLNGSLEREQKRSMLRNFCSFYDRQIPLSKKLGKNSIPRFYTHILAIASSYQNPSEGFEDIQFFVRKCVDIMGDGA